MGVKQTGVVDVAVADGSPLVLTALSEFFDRNREFSLIATTATAEAFIDTVQRVPVDVAVIDWQLPRLGGEQVIRTLKSLGSVVKVVVYGALDPPDVVRRAMAAGAAGFCPRSNSPEELLEVVRGVARLVVPRIERAQRRVGDEHRGHARLEEGEVVAVVVYAERPHGGAEVSGQSSPHDAGKHLRV